MVRYFSELSYIMLMMKDYMDMVCADYKIIRILYTQQKGFEFVFMEFSDTYTLYVKDWEILTEDGQKCIELMKSAYDNCPDMLHAIDIFENKWMELKT